MGQQQLLLVILVTIIVGIATVVAINTFSSASDSANVDAARQDILTIASNAQGWYMKPDMMGGGGNSFTDIEASDVCPGTAPDATTCETENGTYNLTVQASGDELAVSGTPATAGGTLDAVIVQDNILQASGGSEGIAYTAGS